MFPRVKKKLIQKKIMLKKRKDLKKKIIYYIKMDKTIQQWVEKIKQTRPSLTESTLKTYRTRLKKLLTVNEAKDPNFLITTKAEKVIKNLRENGLSQSMIGNLLTVILVLGGILDIDKDKIDFYKKEKLKNQVKYITRQQDQEKNVKENENWVSVAELKRIPNYWKRQFEKTTQNKKINSLKWLVAALYMTGNYLPPERGNIYIKMKYTKTQAQNEIDNYFVNGPEKLLVLNNFKTIKSLGKKVFRIRKNSKIIQALKAYRNYNQTEWLLINPKNNKPFTSARFTEFLQSVFEPTGKTISSLLLRKIFISNFYKNDKKMKERKQLANKMLHSTNVAQTVYEKK